MNTINGVLSLDNNINKEILDKMFSAFNSYAIKDSSQLHNSSKQIFIENFEIHKPSYFQQTKYNIFNKEFLIAYDGRLNDKEELAIKLGVPYLEDITDTYLILHAYIKWGDKFLKEIDGDFAFSIWDEDNKILILAKDRLGRKSLFYTIQNNHLIWSTDLRQLVQYSSVSINQLNKEFLIKYLIEQPYITSETAYKDINRVEPGQCVIVRQKNIRLYQYYNYEFKKIRFNSETDYIENFFDLFKGSVKNIFNTKDPISVSLSGGLDSSSIVSLGYQVNPSVDLRTYSYTFDEYKPGNEDSYIHSLLSMYPTKSTFIKADKLWFFKGDFSKIIGELDEPYPFFNDAFMGEIPRRSNKEGAKIHVAGIYADHLLAGNPKYMALLLKNFKFFKLAKEYKEWMRHGQKFKTLFGEYSLKPLLKNRSTLVPPWIPLKIINNETFKEVINDTSLRNNYLNQEGIYRYIKKLLRGLGTEWTNSFFKAKGVELRLPFYNYKLIEFMAGIPEDLKIKPGVSKYILRQSLKGILPEKIRTRKGKANHEYIVQKGYQKEWEQINKYSDFRVLKELGYIEPDYNYKQHFNQYYSGLTVESNNNMEGLLRALSLEIWLRERLLKGGE